VKTWTGKGRIGGVRYDSSGESDFLQFIICNKPSWWLGGNKPIKPKNGKSKCVTEGKVNEKAIAWVSELMGLDCNGKT